LGAVLLYRYVNVPMLGPFPAMYEPVWFPEAVAALVAGAAALLSGSLSSGYVQIMMPDLSAAAGTQRACGAR